MDIMIRQHICYVLQYFVMDGRYVTVLLDRGKPVARNIS